MLKNKLLKVFFLALTLILGSASFAQAERLVRIGFFPNITHAHALIAQNMLVDDKDWFEQRIPGIKTEWFSFNAGPSAMESLFAKAIDFTYVGPNPALNAYIRSKGDDVRVLSGAVRGGAALVAAPDKMYAAPADFRGAKVATPQLGNTQDIACRHWFKKAGLNVTMTGGDVLITPTPNASMLALLSRGDIDAAWTVEPWVSRLELEAGGRIVFSETAEESITTILAASKAILTEQPDLAIAMIAAHAELNQWILEHPEEARARVVAELSKQIRREFPAALAKNAWPRLIFEVGIDLADFELALEAAKDAGFISGNPDISGLVAHP